MELLQADFRTLKFEDVVVDMSLTDSAQVAVATLNKWGFAIGVKHDDVDPVHSIARILNLLEPYTPELYRLPGSVSNSAGINDITVNSASSHPVFSRASGQELHVDGLLEPMGWVPTTVLHCVSSADSGGETFLFNVCAAFERLMMVRPDAAHLLLGDAVLRRTATIPGVTAYTDGPAFAPHENGWQTRFTVDSTATWNASTADVKLLAFAIEFIMELSIEPEFRVAVTLQPGQALIFRNDQVSHGRTEYTDTATRRRHLLRGLFTSIPSSESTRMVQ